MDRLIDRMSQGPSLLFDKSTLESLSLNEAALLDNFYRSTITPLFFVECLADLERKMVRMRGTPEQLVGSLAERTPDMQSVMNLHHMQILKGELAGQFNLDTVLLRPCVASGKLVELGDSKGMLFQPSEEEEAFQRWARYDFLGLERQFAKRWRKMIEEIDLQAMSTTVLGAIGPWRKPVSIQDTRSLTNTIIDNLDPEWLLRFGLKLLGVPEATDYVLAQWSSDRKKPLRAYRPYFIHMLSINIFFSLILKTQLLKNVKPSHQIDLAYLYYLPFCSVFSSRDNFHVQVAPLFMHEAQQFVHGDDLKADLKRLDELYLRLPKNTLETGLHSFAPVPPDDTSYLTTRLWDAYLPAWRKNSKNRGETPEEIKKALMELMTKYHQASPASQDTTAGIDDLGFAEMSRQIKPVKGDYFRIGKDAIPKDHEEELKKNVKIHPPGTQFSGLMDELDRLLQDSKCTNIEVILLSNKLDDQGEKVLNEGMYIAEIRPIGIRALDEATRELLKQEYERFPVISMLVLWTRYGAGKLGIMRFLAVSTNESMPQPVDYAEWESKAIAAYLDRHNL
jgi:hypothetical protein